MASALPIKPGRFALSHRCTVLRRGTTDTDSLYGDSVLSGDYAAADTDVRCLYAPGPNKDLFGTDIDGQAERGTLYVDPDDSDVVSSDEIGSIVDASGAVVVSGQWRVEAVQRWQGMSAVLIAKVSA